MTTADFAKRMAHKRNEKRAIIRGAAQLVRDFSDRRTGRARGNSKVLRNSRHAGEYETKRWRKLHRFSRAVKEARLNAIWRWSQNQRKPGRAWGPISPKKFGVLKYFYDSRDYVDGRLDPSYTEICTRSRDGACTQTVSDSIKLFQEVGLIEAQRRTVPVEDPEPGGQTNTQITTAYFLIVPDHIEEAVRKELGQLALAGKAEPNPREPGEYEAKAIARLMRAPPGETPDKAARREHRLTVLIEQQNARINAAKNSTCDSSP